MVTECGRKRGRGCRVVYPPHSKKIPTKKALESIRANAASRVIARFAKKSLAKVKAMKSEMMKRSKLFYDPYSVDLSKAKFYDKKIGLNIRKKGQKKSLPSINKFIQQKVRASQQTANPELRKKVQQHIASISKKNSKYEDVPDTELHLM